eukprot:Pgem_evm1s17072
MRTQSAPTLSWAHDTLLTPSMIDKLSTKNCSSLNLLELQNRQINPLDQAVSRQQSLTDIGLNRMLPLTSNSISSSDILENFDLVTSFKNTITDGPTRMPSFDSILNSTSLAKTTSAFQQQPQVQAQVQIQQPQVQAQVQIQQQPQVQAQVQIQPDNSLRRNNSLPILYTNLSQSNLSAENNNLYEKNNSNLFNLMIEVDNSLRTQPHQPYQPHQPHQPHQPYQPHQPHQPHQPQPQPQPQPHQPHQPQLRQLLPQQTMVNDIFSPCS